MKKLKDIKGFIFDLDGTLLDSMAVWMKIYESLFTEHGKQMPDGYLYQVNHLSMAEGAKYTANNTDIGLDEDSIAAFWKAKAQVKYASEIQLKPYAREILELLHKRGVLLGVATASNKQNVTPCLVNNGIYELFHSITSVDEVARGKDFPDIYLKQCENFPLAYEDCAAVEDSYVGALSAKNGGLLSIGTYDESGRLHNTELKQNCDIYFQTLKELYEALL